MGYAVLAQSVRTTRCPGSEDRRRAASLRHDAVEGKAEAGERTAHRLPRFRATAMAWYSRTIAAIQSRGAQP
jgi:hypothetical protein